MAKTEIKYMKKIKWSVNYEWEYDLDKMIKETREYLDNHPNEDVDRYIRMVVSSKIDSKTSFRQHFSFTPEIARYIGKQVTEGVTGQISLF